MPSSTVVPLNPNPNRTNRILNHFDMLIIFILAMDRTQNNKRRWGSVKDVQQTNHPIHLRQTATQSGTARFANKLKKGGYLRRDFTRDIRWVACSFHLTFTMGGWSASLIHKQGRCIDTNVSSPIAPPFFTWGLLMVDGLPVRKPDSVEVWGLLSRLIIQFFSQAPPSLGSVGLLTPSHPQGLPRWLWRAWKRWRSYPQRAHQWRSEDWKLGWLAGHQT